MTWFDMRGYDSRAKCSIPVISPVRYFRLNSAPLILERVAAILAKRFGRHWATIQRPAAARCACAGRSLVASLPRDDNFPAKRSKILARLAIEELLAFRSRNVPGGCVNGSSHSALHMLAAARHSRSLDYQCAIPPVKIRHANARPLDFFAMVLPPDHTGDRPTRTTCGIQHTRILPHGRSHWNALKAAIAWNATTSPP